MKKYSGLVVPILIALILTGCSANPETVAIREQIEKDENRIKKCNEVRAKAQELDDVSAALVVEARQKQLAWITDEMSKLKASGKISTAEWDVFSNFVDVGDGTPKLAIGDINNLMNRIVKAGYIELYLPKEVVDIGTKAAQSPSSSDYLVNFPECFDELEFSVIQSLANLPPTNGAWGDKLKFPIELLP